MAIKMERERERLSPESKASVASERNLEDERFCEELLVGLDADVVLEDM